MAVEGWITLEKARELFDAAGQDFDALKDAARRAATSGPSPLGRQGRLRRSRTQLREVQSRNVVARLEGSDPKLEDEYVVYTAHWDHLGRDPPLEGDQIFNGAADNASGVAALLEIARAFTQLTTPPKRSILFLAVTAEEKGLLGAKYYAEHPLYPLAKTLADINMDVINLWGRTRDIVSVGMGSRRSTTCSTRPRRRRGGWSSPDAEPEKGFFYRSDHFEFAKQGVPALDPKAGDDYIGKPADYGRRKRDEYTAERLPQGQRRGETRLGPLAAPSRTCSCCSRSATASPTAEHYPEWKPGTEFRALREQSLKTAAR